MPLSQLSGSSAAGRPASAFCAPLKKRRWAPGRLVAEPRGSRFSGCAGDCGARVASCGDGGTALRRHVRGLHRTPSKRQLSERLRKDSVTLGPSSVHHPLVGAGRQTRLGSRSKWCPRPLFGMAVSVHAGGYPSHHGATNFWRHIQMLAAARSSKPPAISR
jgi:hypothetical protein